MRQIVDIEQNNQESTAWLQRGMRTDARARTLLELYEGDPSIFFYPKYFSKAAGAHIWDVDGNRYIDFVLGYGPVVLGHAHAGVNSAVIREMQKGICISPLWSPLQVELTELLIGLIPNAEQAYLMKTGSDATAAAVRLARIFTGREKLLRWGYNGWHDWSSPKPDGVPLATRSNTLTFAYNDLSSLETAFARHPGKIACVIMMPFELDMPQPGFLEAVRAAAHRHGALFILDEIRSGFRMSLGGAQQFLNIRPDLSTFSKAMANGYAISAVTGRADVMAGFARTHMFSTFYANPPEMAAAIATITTLRDTDALAHMWKLGTALQQGLREIIREFDAPADVVSYPISPFIQFREADRREIRELRIRFFRETLARGLLFHPNHHWYLSAAHTMDDIEFALDACRAAFVAALRTKTLVLAED